MLNKKFLRILNIAIIVLIILSSVVVFAEDGNDVYVVPIKGMINKAVYQFIQSNVDEIKSLNPSAIIFEIDTYGGYISEAEKVWRLISELDVPTISFVNTKAESAGVLITVSCDKIAMAKGSTIGSAETVPYNEKTQSMWVSWLREAAENKGRNPELVAAMADKGIEIPTVIEKGKLLNLNSSRAKELGFTDIIANDYEEILDNLDIEYNNIIKLETNLRVKVARILTDSYVTILLLTLGFIGLVIEIFAPGFGAGGTLSIIAFSLFFGGNILVGNSGLGVVVLFIVGISLLIIELVVPGFGLPGVGGIAFVALSIIMAMNSIGTAVISLLVTIVLSIIVAILLIKFGYKSPYLDRIILKTKQEKESGYISSSIKKDYIDKEGIVYTYLRPSGTVQIENEKIEAVSEGEFIEKGAKVKVIKVKGPRIIVKRVK